jgi:hypothetical protein
LRQDLPPEEHLRKRQEKIKPLVDEFFAWVKDKSAAESTDKSSETGKSLQYALNQEKYLRVFLEDAQVPLDNNAAEIAIRPFTVGRKNWVLIDTPRGAEASAGIYSIVETAKANGLKLYPYFTYLLEELPKIINEGLQNSEKRNGCFAFAACRFASAERSVDAICLSLDCACSCR